MITQSEISPYVSKYFFSFSIGKRASMKVGVKTEERHCGNDIHVKSRVRLGLVHNSPRVII